MNADSGPGNDSVGNFLCKSGRHFLSLTISFPNSKMQKLVYKRPCPVFPSVPLIFCGFEGSHIQYMPSV